MSLFASSVSVATTSSFSILDIHMAQIITCSTRVTVYGIYLFRLAVFVGLEVADACVSVVVAVTHTFIGCLGLL